MDMQIDRIVNAAGTCERDTVVVTSREHLDALVKESELATGTAGRRFKLPGDTVHTFLVTLDAQAGYGVRHYQHQRAEPAEFMTAQELDTFLSRYQVLALPIGYDGRKSRGPKFRGSRRAPQSP